MFDFTHPPNSDLALIITIPCYNETGLIATLDSLRNCERITNHRVEVLVVINASESTSEEIKKNNLITYNKALSWRDKHTQDGLYFYFELANNLPKKHAGVGLARRIAMDAALERFETIGNPQGVIVCFDADSQCEANYLKEIYRHFLNHPKTPGCSIYYEHPTKGKDYSQEVYTAITQYEKHLRYYNLALRFTGFPGAYHTVGSSMAVRASAYKKQGGMNKRKAGEDFYFLHKIISLGGFTELNTTRVIPSPRSSDRVPFGTGRAVSEILNNDSLDFRTYSFAIFLELRQFFNELQAIYQNKILYANLPKTIRTFIDKAEFDKKIDECICHSSSFETFAKRFFAWFNAFKILKYIHHTRDLFHPDSPIDEEVNQLLENIKLKDENSLLENLRQIEKKQLLPMRKWY